MKKTLKRILQYQRELVRLINSQAEFQLRIAHALGRTGVDFGSSVAPLRTGPTNAADLVCELSFLIEDPAGLGAVELANAVVHLVQNREDWQALRMAKELVDFGAKWPRSATPSDESLHTAKAIVDFDAKWKRSATSSDE